MRYKNIAVSVIVFCCTVYLCISFDGVSECVQNTVRLCCTNVVPALFPFFVLSDIFMQSISGANIPKPIAKLYQKLFRADICTLPVFIAGLISGYPVGAAATYGLYKSGRICKSDAERLICFTNNSGPLFVISAVGSGMFGNIRYGIVLYIIHIIAAIVTAIFIPGKYTKSKLSQQTKPVQTSVTEIIENSFMKCIRICGFVIIFAIINNCISALIQNGFLSTIICCMTEITGGISALSIYYPPETALPVASFALGWSGISVLLQVKSVTRGELGTGKYIIAKLCNGAFSALLCRIYLHCIKVNINLPTETKLPEMLIVAAFIIILIYMCKQLIARHKIKSTV